MLRRRLAGTVALIMALVPTLPARHARADEAQEAAAAETLFREGRTLLGEGRVAEACAKFGESKRLDAAPGTLLNLAQCYEQQGRSASAWVTYRELASLAAKLGQTRRAEFAEEKLAALGPQLALLVVHVAPARRADGLTVDYDGTALGPAAWDTRVPVDPGPHRVVAAAPGRVTWATTVTARAGSATTVDVPDLPPAARVASGQAPAPLRIGGIVTTIVGGTAVATGLVFGGIAKLENDGARRDECSADGCSREGRSRIERADDYARVSTITTVTGLSLVAIGLVMWWLAPPSDRRSAGLGMGPPGLSF